MARVLLALAATSLLACQHRAPASAAAVKVLGGVESSARPEVVRILNVETSVSCTGTFVNDTTLLTASHCISVDTVGGGIGLYSDTDVRAVARYYHTTSPELGCSGKPYPVELVEMCPQYDVAVLVFPEGTGASLGLSSYPSMSGASVQQGEAVRLYGYGPVVMNGASGEKNTQYGSVSGAFGDHFTLDAGNFNAPSTGEAGILPGDSGGPVFDGLGRIVGINSGFRWWDDGGFRSFVVDLRGPNSLAVLNYAFSNADPALRPGPIAGF